MTGTKADFLGLLGAVLLTIGLFVTVLGVFGFFPRLFAPIGVATGLVGWQLMSQYP